MPLGRYFAAAGGVLLALLFLLDWYLPSPAAEPARADIDRSIIRLQSRHKWPSAVVFDTSQPAIGSTMAAVAEAAPPAKTPPEPAKSPLEALAMAQPREPSRLHAAAPAATPRRVVRRARIARAPAPRMAGYDMVGFRNPFPASW